MNNSAYNWSIHRVRAWACDIGFESTSDLILAHGIDGKDLFMLTDSDLKQELRLSALHDRKVLKREIQLLRNATEVVVQTRYLGDIIDVLISNPWTYTFDHLRHDLSAIISVPARELVLQDRNGYVWGFSAIVQVLDSSLVQVQSIYAIRSDSRKRGQPVLTDDEDFDEAKNSPPQSPIPHVDDE